MIETRVAFQFLMDLVIVVQEIAFFLMQKHCEVNDDASVYRPLLILFKIYDYIKAYFLGNENNQEAQLTSVVQPKHH